MIIKFLAIGGYRSFGDEPQRLERLGKINIFIGKNNCGKSNILRFMHDVYPSLSKKQNPKLGPLDRHLPSKPPFTIGCSRSMSQDEHGNHMEFADGLRIADDLRSPVSNSLFQLLQERAKEDGTDDAWFYFDERWDALLDGWDVPLSSLEDSRLSRLWSELTGRQGGGRSAHWVPETLRAIAPSLPTAQVYMVPAIRKVGEKGSISDDFSGEGIIERLVKLQNPDVLSQADREKFERINQFLRYVTDTNEATLEVPHDRETILVHMDGKTLPLASLGSGIHEVLILAAVATVLDGAVICLEEPELHLNPILQKKLIRYLRDSSNNQYFITTHSAALMDAAGVEVYHVTLRGGQSFVTRVASGGEKSLVCEDLGYRPSDLLQANCVIWVEGPSDRIYIKYWLAALKPDLVEGLHYSIMFYGGRLASHISGVDFEELVDDLISLRRLNRRSVIVIDSDRRGARDRINATKKRLQSEFDSGPGFAWITKGREIENYVSPEEVAEAISSIHPSAKLTGSTGYYDNLLEILTRSGTLKAASKVSVARYVAEHFCPHLDLLDLRKQVSRLSDFIVESNHGAFDKTLGAPTGQS